MRVLASLSVVIVAFLWTSQCDFTAAVPQQRDESSNGYMNEWAVEVAAGPQAADRVAATHGLKNVGKITGLKDTYKFVLPGPTRLKRPQLYITKALLSESNVKLVEQQKLRMRVTKIYDPPNDPAWEQQWYLLQNGSLESGEKRDMNVEHVWLQGITGCGSVVGLVDTGVDHLHPDLLPNYIQRLGYDYYDNDPDPSPGLFSSHGTSVAGVVGMAKGNGICGVGVAYDASITGIRLLGGSSLTDIQEAQALSHRSDVIDVYSNSWGPFDTGAIVSGPGPLLQKQLELGVKEGRNGKGSIFVFASGNGGESDSCAVDGYVSSIYTIGVGSVTSAGHRSYYDENCSCKMTVAFVDHDDYTSVTATTPSGGCSNYFSGTSAAAPIAAGIIALALEANPTLTWRDVQYLIAYTSNPDLLPEGDWATNGAGLNVSHKHGFGVMDAEAMVIRARLWMTVPEQQSYSISPGYSCKNVTPFNITFQCAESTIQFLEHVVVSLSLTASGPRGGAQLELISPSGTRSMLLDVRPKDRHPGSYKKWPFMSLHYWGENPHGQWTLSVRYTLLGSLVLNDLNVTFYGTSEIPESIKMIPEVCHSRCRKGCAAVGKRNCDSCKMYRNAHNLKCTTACHHTLYHGFCYYSDATPNECKNILTGSCVAAGYTECCKSGDCLGQPETCSCSHSCYNTHDCCDDIASVCQPTEDIGCSADTFDCGDGECIPDYWVCDYIPDCYDQSDEENCTCSMDDYICDNGTCIPGYWECDGIPDCVDYSDEENCTSCFDCGNGTCIAEYRVCNGIPDCGDSSDEENCSCSLSQFDCGNGTCIPGYQECDGTHDCENGSDEESCTSDCAYDEFACSFGRQCIPMYWKCDGTSDCEDSSDELSCSMLHATCENETETLTAEVPDFFYPFGENEGDARVLAVDDGSSPPVNLSHPFPFYSNTETVLYVNTNGVLSFRDSFTPPRSEISLYYVNTPVPIIAIFWEDVDITQRGSIYYRESTNATLREAFRKEIEQKFPRFSDSFTPEMLFVATWYSVAQFGGGSEVNTFQSVLGTDGLRSFVSFRYGEIQWGTRTFAAGVVLGGGGFSTYVTGQPGVVIIQT